MSALARHFHRKGIKVSGYDKVSTVLTKELEAEGIAVHYVDDLSQADKDADIVVYTPAIPASHSELQYFRKSDRRLVKRSEVLGMVTEGTFNICVAGTHGKTTTSSLIAHILRDSGFGCNAFLGGVSANYNTNTWSSEKNVSVAEADEYDRSFLQLSPDIAVITSMDPDHLDIYGTAESMEDAFIQFAKKIKPGGLLIHKKGLKRENELIGMRRVNYSLYDEQAEAYAQNVRIADGGYEFDAVVRGKIMKGIRLHMGGEHNIENTIACLVICDELKIDEERVRNAVGNFKGVKRRFEYIVKAKNLVVIDDYAHHPEELRALISGAMELFPGMKCTVVFQPHLYSRTNDHAKGFGEVLTQADEVILLPIYPAREEPMPGVESEMILEHIHHDKKKVIPMNELVDYLAHHKVELLVICGAGDIDTIVEPVKNLFEYGKN